MRQRALALLRGLEAPEAERLQVEADLRQRSSQIAAMSLFFTLEINKLEDDELELALKANKQAQRWRPWLRRVDDPMYGGNWRYARYFVTRR